MSPLRIFIKPQLKEDQQFMLGTFGIQIIILFHLLNWIFTLLHPHYFLSFFLYLLLQFPLSHNFFFPCCFSLLFSLFRSPYPNCHSFLLITPHQKVDQREFTFVTSKLICLGIGHGRRGASMPSKLIFPSCQKHSKKKKRFSSTL